MSIEKGKLTGIFFLAGLAILILLGVWNFRFVQVDDAYITYRYARNLANGQGFAYNPPRPDFGTTTPLYTLLLTLVAILGINIPVASLFFSGASLFAMAALFYLYGREQGSALSAYLPAMLVVILPGSVLVLGMETTFYTALIYFALYWAVQRQHSLAVILAALATLTRYDGILVAAIVLFWEWYKTKTLPIRNGLLFSGILVIWLAYAAMTFGSPLPNSFLAKSGDFTGNVFLAEFADNLFILTGFFSVGAISAWAVFGGIFAFLVLIGTWIKDSFPRLVTVWCFSYLIAYTLLGLRYTFHWYYYPPLPGLILVLILSVQAVRDKALQKMNWFSAQLFTVFLLGPIIAIITLGEFRLIQQADASPGLGGRNEIYTLAANWICQHSSEQTSIAIPEIGLIGWYCDRRIIDPYGLVSPEIIPYVQKGDRLGGVISLRPDLIAITNVQKDGQPFSIPSAGRFMDEYTVGHVIEQENYPYYFVIFEKKK
jgi:hypothetical protein